MLPVGSVKLIVHCPASIPSFPVLGGGADGSGEVHVLLTLHAQGFNLNFVFHVSSKMLMLLTPMNTVSLCKQD